VPAHDTPRNLTILLSATGEYAGEFTCNMRLIQSVVNAQTDE